MLETCPGGSSIGVPSEGAARAVGSLTRWKSAPGRDYCIFTSARRTTSAHLRDSAAM